MRDAKRKLKVLFLCTGNSCRSQMAEGWARHLKSDTIDPYSAGIYPVGVSSRATEVMAEKGVDISGQTSKHVDDLAGIDFDYVVTLCDSARQQCPVFGGPTKRVHRGFEDPIAAVGTEEQIMEAFRKTRDAIKRFVVSLPDGFGADGS